MFVTSSLIVPGRLNGVAGADTECANRAAAAGLPGTYKAWISDKTATVAIDANTRVGNGGWVRTDGRPFAASLAALKAGNQLFYPPRVDENGNDLGPTRIAVATGGNSNGTNFGPQCTNYTSTVGSMYIGMGTAGAQYWAYNELDSVGCSDSLHLYCFRTDLGGAVTVPPTMGRRIFTSANPFIPGGGLQAADVQCQNDAKNAGLANFGGFLALLATSTSPAIARFNTVGLPWKRLDDVLVVLDPADLGQDKLVSPIDMLASGAYASYQVWTGASDVSAPASDGFSCNDWTVATTAASSYYGYAAYAQNPDWFNSGRTTCDDMFFHVMCAER
jgi:hypothetical protein